MLLVLPECLVVDTEDVIDHIYYVIVSGNKSTWTACSDITQVYCT